MTDVIDHLYRKELQAQEASSSLESRYAALSAAGFSALPCDLLGDQWGHDGWRETCGALIRMVGKLSQDIAALQKERQ